MKRPDDLVSKNLTTGESRTINVDPHVYTSVADWKPVTPDRFAALLHTYSVQTRNLDRFNHGLMSYTGYQLDHKTEAVIWYTVKEVDSPVSSPVLMTITYADTGKVICFSSLCFGIEADPDRKRGD